MSTRAIEFGIVVISAAFAAFFYLEDRHASRQSLLGTEIDLRQEILDRDIKKQAEARVYYKDIERSRGLEPPEQSRLDYLEEQLEQKYEDQQMLQQKELELK